MFPRGLFSVAGGKYYLGCACVQPDIGNQYQYNHVIFDMGVKHLSMTSYDLHQLYFSFLYICTLVTLLSNSLTAVSLEINSSNNLQIIYLNFHFEAPFLK